MKEESVVEQMPRVKELSRLAHLKKIERESETVDRLKRVWQEKKDASLAAKKEFDTASAALLEMIRNGPDEQLKLFESESPAVESVPVASPKKKEPEPVDWRSLPLASLDVSNKIRSKLLTANILTIGQLKDVIDIELPEEFPKGLFSIKGLTKSVVGEIAVAVDDLIPVAEKLEDQTEGESISEVSQDESPDGEGESQEAAFDGVESSVSEPAEQSEVVDEISAEVEEPAAVQSVDESTVEAVAEVDSEDASEAMLDQTETGRIKIRILETLEGVEPEHGCVKGAVMLGYLDGDSAVVVSNAGTEVLLNPGEFEVVGNKVSSAKK